MEAGWEDSMTGDSDGRIVENVENIGAEPEVDGGSTTDSEGCETLIGVSETWTIGEELDDEALASVAVTAEMWGVGGITDKVSVAVTTEMSVVGGITDETSGAVSVGTKDSLDGVPVGADSDPIEGVTGSIRVDATGIVEL